MQPRSFLRLAILAAVFNSSVHGAAPDAGQVLRDQPQLPDAGRPAAPLAPTQAPATTARQAGGIPVEVRAFRFSGSEGIATEAELQSAVAAWTRRTLPGAELQDATAAVTTFLRQKGFLLARAYLPRQDVTAGTVEIAIVQAKVDGSVGIRRGAGSRISETRLQSVADAAVVTGQALQEQGLERALLLINDLPGVMGRVLLEQGGAPGTTHVSLDVSEASLLSGSLWADNFGSRYTGALRGNGLLFLNDPTGRGDQFSVLLSGAEDMAQGRATYSTPLGSSGLKGSVSGSMLDYSIGKEFAALDLKGDALTLNGWLTYPLVLRRDRGVTASLGYEFKALNDETAGTDTRDRRLGSGSLGLNGFFRDALGGGGYNAWSVSVTAGSVDLAHISSDKAQDQAGPQAAGGFTRLNLSLSRLQQLPAQLTFSAAYFGQLASCNLNSSEKLSLGGPYGVRAYPVGEASGDEGHQLNFELRRDLALGVRAGTLQLVGFFDTGFIRLNQHRWTGDVNSATRKNSYQLSGAGAGLNYSWGSHLSLRLSYAWQIGSNPGRSAEGNNADGRDASGCFWATGQYRF
jgi:hemolysin activation/secretion protein